MSLSIIQMFLILGLKDAFPKTLAVAKRSIVSHRLYKAWNYNTFLYDKVVRGYSDNIFS